jgi:hypothetical protein
MKGSEVHPFDEIFTHVADGTGEQTSYNVTALYKHVIANLKDVQKVTVPVDEEHARYCMERRGVEADRLNVLVANPEYCKKPVLFVALADGSHLLVDGTHRYVVFFAAKMEVIPAYIVPAVVAAPFVVEDMPQTNEDDLMEWSGLSLLRALGMKES